MSCPGYGVPIPSSSAGSAGQHGTGRSRGATLRISLGRVAPYRVGEVVAFVQDAGICVHRVAFLGRSQRARDYIITQGDACFYPDPPISTPLVLGPVTEFRLKGDWVPTADQASVAAPGRFSEGPC